MFRPVKAVNKSLHEAEEWYITRRAIIFNIREILLSLEGKA
jgi:hypothetical protein